MLPPHHRRIIPPQFNQQESSPNGKAFSCKRPTIQVSWSEASYSISSLGQQQGVRHFDAERLAVTVDRSRESKTQFF